MMRFRGSTAAEGMAIGQVRRIDRGRPGFSPIVEAPAREKELLGAAMQEAVTQLDALEKRTAGEENRGILSFQSLLLEDGGLRREAETLIEQGMGAAAAIARVGRENAARMRALTDNPYMQLRGADILDACLRVEEILSGRGRIGFTPEYPVILAAETLLPSDLAAAPPGTLLGAVTAAGSAQSHAAILARGLGIPLVVQLGEAFLAGCDGHIAALDADRGEVMLDPTPAERQAIVGRLCAQQQRSAQLASLRDLPCRTRDGAEFTLLANCFGPEDIAAAMDAGAAGVGLLRSEMLLLRDGVQPDEDQQFAFYRACLEAAGGRPVTIRTFDFGAEKTTEPLAEPQDNPALGLRGVRYSLAHPQQFEAQLCALLRAGRCGPLSVELPMISSVDDWDRTMRVVEHTKELLRRRGVPFCEALPFGVTLEVPAACLEADRLPAHGCRFFDIGTNDLVQYTHAADRNAAALEPYYRADSPAVRRLVAMSVEAARAGGIPITVCGMAMESPQGAVGYLQQGIRAFSMAAQNILAAKQALLAADAVPAAPCP